MKFDLNNDIFLFPTIPYQGEHFPSHLKNYFTNYILYVTSLGCSPDIISKIEKFAYNIIVCLNEYYCGQHNSAQYFFNLALDTLQIKNFYRNLSSDTFYRARSSTGSTFSSGEMFHVPFQDRYKVKPQRYSYPGLPCLYLGSSIDVCCKELECWDNNLNIAIVKKNTSKEIRIFDLYFFEEYDYNNLSPLQQECFVLLWPLVVCCSFIYNDTNDMSFRPDYIIPQLLLEYIIDKNAEEEIHGRNEIIYGIRYHSVKQNPFQSCVNLSKGNYINYVFPVFSNKASGCCKTLMDLFKVEKVFKLSEKQKYINKI